MLFKGWQRLFHDLIGREGPFLETVCVPFAGLAIMLWPLAVVGAVIAAFASSFFLGLYGSIITYQVCRIWAKFFSRHGLTNGLPILNYFFYFSGRFTADGTRLHRFCCITI